MLFLQNKPHEFLAVIAEINDSRFVYSNPAVFIRYKITVAVLAELSLKLPWHLYPVLHDNLSG